MWERRVIGIVCVCFLIVAGVLEWAETRVPVNAADTSKVGGSEIDDLKLRFSDPRRFNVLLVGGPEADCTEGLTDDCVEDELHAVFRSIWVEDTETGKTYQCQHWVERR